MKHDSNYEIKTLFDPLSKEWEGTSYEEKRILLVDSFKEYKNFTLFSLKHLVMRERQSIFALSF